VPKLGVRGVRLTVVGTDHPFFPPLAPGEKKWASVETNRLAVSVGLQEGDVRGVMGQNAIDILGLEVDVGALSL
jgi:hypothetical protein